MMDITWGRTEGWWGRGGRFEGEKGEGWGGIGGGGGEKEGEGGRGGRGRGYKCRRGNART